MIKSLAPTPLCPRLSPKIFLIIFLFMLAGHTARAAAAHDSALRENDVRRGERILAKLRDLDEAQTESASFSKRGSGSVSNELFAQTASLRESELKIELTTALFLYDEVLREGLDSSSMLARARLHTRWAWAMIKEYRGAKDGTTTSALEEMKRERRDDLRLCEEALDALKSLEGEVYEYSSLAEFEEHGHLARVSFEQLSLDVSRMLERVDRTLGMLARGPLFYPIYHARNAYADGLYWWQKTRVRSELVVNVNSFKAPDELNGSRLDPGEVNYTIAINWRKAIRHTREAARLIEALKTGL